MAWKPASDTQEGDGPVVLLVDDRRSYLLAFSRLLSKRGLRCELAANAIAALTILESSADTISVIVSDEEMPGMNGFTLLDKVHQRWPHIERMLLTAFTHAELINLCRKEGYEAVDKEIDNWVIANAICKLAEQAVLP